MKHVIAIACIVYLAYLYRSNTNDIKAVIDPKNICPPKTRLKTAQPPQPDPKTMSHIQLITAQQAMILYREEEKMALEKDRLAKEKMFQENGKPCHEKQPKKESTPIDLLEKVMQKWGWY
jgi:hypothetical protein